MSIHIIEAATQVTLGTVVIFLSNLAVFPLLGIQASVSANAWLVAINTCIAFLKSYWVRWVFRRFTD